MAILARLARFFTRVAHTGEGATTHIHVCPAGNCHRSWHCSVWDGSCGTDLCQSCELDRRDQWIKSVMAKGRS